MVYSNVKVRAISSKWVGMDSRSGRVAGLLVLKVFYIAKEK